MAEQDCYGRRPASLPIKPTTQKTQKEPRTDGEIGHYIGPSVLLDAVTPCVLSGLGHSQSTPFVQNISHFHVK